jgi:arsenate reductase (thioredoxin)
MARAYRILFLCTGNSARSQMAEGFARHFAGDRLEVFSAGTNPVPVNPLAIQVMQEVGIDISGQVSKGLADVPRDLDLVVTVCDQAAETCPLFPGEVRVEHISFEDPAAAQGSLEEKLAVFRRIRDEIAEAVRELLASLA